MNNIIKTLIDNVIKFFDCRRKRPAIGNMPELLQELISVDSMLCQSAAIAQLQFQGDPVKLYQIVCNQYVGLESVLEKSGIRMIRSVSGTEYDPEVMTAFQKVFSTEDANLHGKVALSVTPRYVLACKDGQKEQLLKSECVSLYCYNKGEEV